VRAPIQSTATASAHPSPQAARTPPTNQNPSGVATALKILFATHDCDAPAPGAAAASPPVAPDDLSLERNEAIALINLLARFSNSLHLHRELSARLAAESGAAPALQSGAAVS
jgi:hypothetical protein